MDSFLRDISAATSGSGTSNPMEDAATSRSPHIIEQVTVDKGDKKTSKNATASADDDAKHMPPQPTAEEQKQMLEFLAQLETLKDTDPAEYAKAMESLLGGPLPAGQSGKGGDAAANGETLSNLISAVQGMRNAGDGSGAGGGAVDPKIGLPGQKPATPGILITPEPGFTFKTRRVGDESETGKIFVNVCIHEKLTPPGLKKRLNEEGEEVEGMNIPMSVGAGRKGEDKSGVACLIYDIIVNPEVVTEAASDKSGKYRDFVCQLGMQCLEQKYSLTLDRRYKLPKLKYIGEPDSQMIQDRSKAPVIEEVSKDSPTAKKAAAAKLKKSQHEAKAAAAAQKLLERTLGYFACWVTKDDAEPQVEKLEVGNGDYKEPLLVCDDNNIQSIKVTAQIESYELEISKMELRASPFRLFVKLPSYKPLSLYFPCAVDPNGITCSLKRREGFAGLIDMTVILPVDNKDWKDSIDPGSKPWLLSNALANDGDSTDYNPYSCTKDVTPIDGQNAGQLADGTYAEDRFHVRLPSNVDQYTGHVEQNQDDGELPEERFHKQDATSQYHIQQREQGVKDKWDKHSKEKEEREANPDPNVEYIDMEDFKPGGSRGPKLEESVVKELTQQEAMEEDLRKASEVVAAAVPKNPALEGLGLSSDLWKELI